jgi:hypothetical protein
MQDAPLCAAVGCNDRITRTKHNTIHCIKHRKLFLPKYNEYKKATARIQKYLDNPSLLECANNIILIGTYFHIAAHLRKEYQDCAIKPELRDEGHNNFITSLLCMSRVLLEKLSPNTDSGSDSSSVEDEDVDRRAEIYEAIKSDTYDLEQELDKCIKENALIISRIEDNLFDFVDLINQYLQPQRPIDLHSSDIMPIQICENLLKTLTETIHAYEASRGLVDFSKCKSMVRPSGGKVQCLKDPSVCIKAGVCPADYFTTTIELIRDGRIRHPVEVFRRAEYPIEFIIAIRDIILYERKDEAVGGYVMSFADSDHTSLLMEIKITPLSEMKGVDVVIADKKKFKTVKL